MAHTPLTSVHIPPALIDAATRKHGVDGATKSDVVRAALAAFVGVDVADYTPRRTGRPPRPRNREVAA
jgi:hypothetical protein